MRAMTLLPLVISIVTDVCEMKFRSIDQDTDTAIKRRQRKSERNRPVCTPNSEYERP